ncbi:Hypothetical protein PHPALM_3393 [Phytophthora palmivora]|uniref:Uncharacterized protein n=1 Tax=Phytophthora palmivora TaxID=4796 RepID=A0A2P4YMH9_9STRA|nr:Hypothetical protein PHPALM_3393 [Phytophthora palmivora]
MQNDAITSPRVIRGLTDAMKAIVHNSLERNCDELFVLCDSRREGRLLVPDISGASDASPFQLDLTCYSLLETCMNAQQDPRCISNLHEDGTNSMMRQTYSVYILGISDNCAHFFPVV